MRRFVKVAGFEFSVEVPSGGTEWTLPGNYKPFELAGQEDRALLFSLVVDNEADVPEAEVVYDGVTGDPDMPLIRVMRAADGRMVLEFAPTQKSEVCSRLVTNSDYTDGVLKILDRRMGRFALDNALMVMFAFTAAERHTLEMHASVTLFQGRGYLFLGKSGTGKSTHSRLWLENIEGTSLLNDDNPIVRIGDDGVARVYGSPWSGKTPCYVNDSAPVGAFVRIRQCKENRIEPMKVVEAYASLYTSCSGFKADRAMADGLHDTMEQLVSTVPSFILDCLPDAEAAYLCNRTVTACNE